ncbi:MAG TPA: phosphatidylserine decarboxylase [Candidatus Dormibacteraeota bacterium]|nr:phosphatidylserine decarboxylase [Candidatus Dormibacteraeota bacterium]
MVKEGYLFAAVPFVLGLSAILVGRNRDSSILFPLAGVLLLLALFILYFFRDPERVIPAVPNAVVSPADGRVVVVVDEAYNGRPGKRMSIFLAVWNVHVNRAPMAGRISKLEYRPGRFYAAMRSRASAENEQNIFHLDTATGEIVFKQIAGAIARRVVSWKSEGAVLARGERIGIVRFGSRVDVWLPHDAEILVRTGQHVAGGSSILAYWPPKGAQ